MDLTPHALPAVLADAVALAAAGPVDTTPLHEGAVLFDVSDQELWHVSGRDRVRFLHAMLSNDVQSLTPGTGVWATFNTVKGRAVSDCRLFVVDDDRKKGHLLALLEPGAGAPFVDGLEVYKVAEKVIFERTDDRLWLLAGAGVDAALAAAGGEAPEPGLYRHAEASIGGATVRAIRLDRASPGGDLLLVVRPEHEETVLSAFAGVARGDRALLEGARVEAAMPRFGVDFTPDNIPLEAGLSNRAIHFNKGCYIGQEVICRIDSMGAPKRKLMRLLVQGDAAPGDDVFANGKAVGHVTSALRSKRVGATLALGYVKKRFQDASLEFRIGRADGPLAQLGGEV
jgi:folate-binding protein YgfZ